jgi:hypothetical protein
LNPVLLDPGNYFLQYNMTSSAERSDTVGETVAYADINLSSAFNVPGAAIPGPTAALFLGLGVIFMALGRRRH